MKKIKITYGERPSPKAPERVSYPYVHIDFKTQFICSEFVHHEHIMSSLKYGHLTSCAKPVITMLKTLFIIERKKQMFTIFLKIPTSHPRAEEDCHTSL